MSKASVLITIVSTWTFFNLYPSQESNSWIKDLRNKKLLRFESTYLIELLKNTCRDLPQSISRKQKFLITNESTLHFENFQTIGGIDHLQDDTVKNGFFVVYYHTDDDYYTTLKRIKDCGGKFLSLKYYGKTRYVWTDKSAMLAIDDTFSFGEKVSHLNLDVHETICQAIKMTKDLPGAYVEIGVYKGGSALTALHYMKHSGIRKKAYFLDTFDGMTYEEAHNSSDILWDNTHILWGVDQTMKYVSGLLQTTGQQFKLVRSNICSSLLPSEIEKVAVCNMDVDLYEATIAGLVKIAPKVVKGGIIICEDPTSTPALGGALLAMEEFLATDEGKKFCKVLLNRAQYILIKMVD